MRIEEDSVYQTIPFSSACGIARFTASISTTVTRGRFNFGAGNQRYYSFSTEAGNLDSDKKVHTVYIPNVGMEQILVIG